MSTTATATPTATATATPTATATATATATSSSATPAASSTNGGDHQARGGGRGARGGGGGGRGRGRDRGGDSGGGRGGGGGGDAVHMSKKLSYLLRHGAMKEGLNISKEGFVSMEDMVRHTRFSEECIMECVTSSDKQRFAVQDIEGKTYIRANQGHSIPVEDLDLKKVASAKEIPVVVHGTYHKGWAVIKHDGLSRMGRNHIHFASGHFTDEAVISGMRKTAEVLIYVNAGKAMQDGIEFFLSANGVILTAGDKRGYIEPKYFEKVVDSKGSNLEFTIPSSGSSSSSSTSSTTTTSTSSSSSNSTSTSSSTPSSSQEPNPPKKTKRSKRKPKNRLVADAELNGQ